MFDILARYALVEMLDAEDKVYRAKQQNTSDKEANVREVKKCGLTEMEKDMIKQLSECIAETKDIQRRLDEIKSDLKKLTQ